jgi:cytochrome c-type biogenesis protein CcmE
MDVTPDANPAPDLDLSPRPAPASGGRGRRKRAWAPVVLLVLVLVGVGYVAAQALTTATMFFYNADEAVAKQDQLGTSRFRLQGTVEPGTITHGDTGVSFVVSFNGAEVSVAHQGDPPELFRDAMPVVLEGRWSSDHTHFDSDRMLVKHDATYTAKNSDRLKQADEGGTVPPTPSVVP